MPCLRWQADHDAPPKFRLAPQLALTGSRRLTCITLPIRRIPEPSWKFSKVAVPRPKRDENLHLHAWLIGSWEIDVLMHKADGSI